MTLTEVLERFRDAAQGNRSVMGASFERLIANLLRRHPVYAGTVSEVWRWSDFPARGQLTATGTDAGIDLVVQTKGGDFWAVQCKCYAPDHYVSKPDMDSFLALSSKKFSWGDRGEVAFSHRLIFASTNLWNRQAEALLEGQTPPCVRISLANLESMEAADWGELSGLTPAAPVEPKILRDYQLEALKAVAQHYAPQPDGTLAHTRGRLIMACGTGKTLTSLRILEQECGGRGLALFLVPSIALLNQTLVAWSEDAVRPINAVCVCSDSKAAKRSKQDDGAVESTVDLALPPCTDAAEVARRIRYGLERCPDVPTVVFSTYQSIRVVEEAQKLIGREAHPFDFVFCDEAHRTTGQLAALEQGDDASAFTRVHDDANILARRRLYMTATPRIYQQAAKVKAREKSIMLCSMDDPLLYGEEVYSINFATAVEKGCLSDYKVFVLTLPETGFEGFDAFDRLTAEEQRALMSKDDDGRATAIKVQGAINALAKRLTDSVNLDDRDREPARRAVAFCRTIAASKAIAKVFETFRTDAALAGHQPLAVEARHVDGSMGAAERETKLSWLKADPGPGTCRLLTNVRCLSEGVDVPSLDAAVFLSRRNNEIEVVQSVGRVMRRAKGKRYGYIIIPVVIPQGTDPEKVLSDRNTFGVVWSVLNALRAHDDRFEAEINQLKFRDVRNRSAPNAGTEGDSEAEGDRAAAGGQLISAGGHIVVDDGSGLFDGGTGQTTFTATLFPPERMEEFRQLLYARLVENCGERAYFERWASDVADIAQRHVAELRRRVAELPAARDAFARYYAFLQTAVYATITEEDAYILLAQQRITEPVFNALFGNSDFTAHNPLSQALDHASRLFEDLESEEDRGKLDKFYDAVRRRVQGITSPDGRLEIIRTLYDTFFAKAFPTVAQKLGIVFTPIEAVDFILRSADGALRRHFGRCLSDKGVHILDPFTGTGTFVARLLQRDIGLIRRDDLYRKYTQELHANEIVLLSYYIAAVNIENIFHDRQGRRELYTAFPGIVFGDTFRMREVRPEDTLDDGDFFPNSERLLAQNRAPISVIVGNPPYSVGQKSANDNAQNENYPWLNRRLEETYVAHSDAVNNKSLYDAYIEAFRWSSDRLDSEQGGVLCFISNGGWLDSNAGAGFRRSIQKEFDEIYCFNLRGNQNTQGEISRREGGKLFDSGCRCPISILLLVRFPKERHRGQAVIHYKDIGDYKSREEKLHDLMMYRSFFSEEWLTTSEIITPNEHGDWINQRNDDYEAYIPLAPEKKFVEGKSIFVTQALGVATNRDVWVYDFSESQLVEKMSKTIACFNETKGGTRLLDPSKISWSTNLTKAHESKKTQTLDMRKIRVAAYRPFQRMRLYFDGLWNERRGVSPKLFPTGRCGENLAICVSGVGVQKAFSCIMVGLTPDLELIGKSQCFPLYWYEEKDVDLFGGRTLERHDGVSDWIVSQVYAAYRMPFSKEDIFYYVYGFLHQPVYRETFAADLKKSLPRIPLAATAEVFRRTAEIGRALAELHLHYEACEPYPLTEVGSALNPRVEKMAFPGKDRTKVRINDTLTLEGIPPEAHDYVVNGRSPIEWVLDRYQVKTDKASGIVNDPNTADPEILPGIEHGAARALADLIARLVTLSLRTRSLIAQLPPFEPETERAK